MNQRILVPLDGSEHAQAALSVAWKLASLSNAEIILLRVIECPSEVYASFYPNPLADPVLDETIRHEKEILRDSAKNYLEQLASNLKSKNRKISFEIQEGPVVDAILTTTEKRKVNLIVMSSIGHGQNKWMVGAVASRILREASVPVILTSGAVGGTVSDRSSVQHTPLETHVEDLYVYSR